MENHIIQNIEIKNQIEKYKQLLQKTPISQTIRHKIAAACKTIQNLRSQLDSTPFDQAKGLNERLYTEYESEIINLLPIDFFTNITPEELCNPNEKDQNINSIKTVILTIAAKSPDIAGSLLARLVNTNQFPFSIVFEFPNYEEFVLPKMTHINLTEYGDISELWDTLKVIFERCPKAQDLIPPHQTLYSLLPCFSVSTDLQELVEMNTPLAHAMVANHVNNHWRSTSFFQTFPNWETGILPRLTVLQVDEAYSEQTLTTLLTKCKDIEILRFLHNNDLSGTIAIPTAVLKNLKILDNYCGSQKWLPNDFEKLEEFSGQSLYQLPEGLHNLQTLTLTRHEHPLPNDLENLRYLKLLHCSVQLPETLSSLQTLRIEGSGAPYAWPKNLDELMYLELLGDHSYTEKLPETLFNLKTLKIEKGYLHALPNNLSTLKHLELPDDYAEMLPADLSSLEILKIGKNYPHPLPNTLSALEELKIGSGYTHRLPDSVTSQCHVEVANDYPYIHA